MGMIIWHYLKSGELYSMDTFIDRVYEMFIAVIGGYIVKSAIENSIRITFSVISDYLDKKTALQTEKENIDMSGEDDEGDCGGEDMSGLGPN
jgi:hypothetical protein